MPLETMAKIRIIDWSVAQKSFVIGIDDPI